MKTKPITERHPDWGADIDEHGNTMWMAYSPYEEGFVWRFKQILRRDKIMWIEAHDHELLDNPDNPKVWRSIREAKAAVTVAYRDILQEEYA